MRFKPDGTLDEVWRGPVPRRLETPEQQDEEMGERILANVLRDHPGLTREDAQAMLDHFL